MHKVRGVRSTAGRWLAAIRGAGSPPRRRDPRRVAGEAPAELGWLSGPPSIWAWLLAAAGFAIGYLLIGAVKGTQLSNSNPRFKVCASLVEGLKGAITGSWP